LRNFASYGFRVFRKLPESSHTFFNTHQRFAGEDLHGPLTEFLSDGISLLETDLLRSGGHGSEVVEISAAFKERYRFRVSSGPAPDNYAMQRQEEP